MEHAILDRRKRPRVVRIASRFESIPMALRCSLDATVTQVPEPEKASITSELGSEEVSMILCKSPSGFWVG